MMKHKRNLNAAPIPAYFTALLVLFSMTYQFAKLKKNETMQSAANGNFRMENVSVGRAFFLKRLECSLTSYTS